MPTIIKDKKLKHRLCLRGLQRKEEGDTVTYSGLVATTHPDRAMDDDVAGDVLSKQVIDQITDYVNTTTHVGDESGSYRSISLYHDWILEEDTGLDEVGFMKPTARTVELDGGHYGTEVDFEINKFYDGKMTPDEVAYRIEQGGIGGLSIEYDTTEENCRVIEVNGEPYRFIEELTGFGGVGLARSRRIANPHAVIYKEFENKVKELNTEDKRKWLRNQIIKSLSKK